LKIALRSVYGRRWPVAIKFGLGDFEDTQSLTGGAIAVAGSGNAIGAVVIVTAIELAG
jgi:hypothetical protein